MHRRIFAFAVHLIIISLLAIPAWAGEPVADAFDAGDGNEIPLLRYSAPGPALVLWLPSESGLLEEDKQVAAALAEEGVEVWMADLHGAYFLPTISSSIERMPAGDTAALIEHVRQVSGKRVYVFSSGRGAVLALRAAHQWQSMHADAPPLAGVILVSPALFVRTPEPGLDGEFLPVVAMTNLPLFIFQPEKSIWRWKMERIIPALSKGGSDVFARLLPEVRDRFWYRSDAMLSEHAMTHQFPVLLKQALPVLEAVAQKPRRVAATDFREPEPPAESRTERALRSFAGDPTPPALNLIDLAGKVHGLQDYRNEVVLVNFWASWCPPCVHEMPSMQRLKDKLAGRPFRILAVNMAEEKSEINAFLSKMSKVDFTILLDADGAALGRWKVFAFPTTYVIGKDGTIRYALFGAIDWDSADVVSKLKHLLAEP